MSKPKRLASAMGGETCFVTSSTDGRERYFIYSKYTELFIDTLYRYRSQGKDKVHSFVVMPEHFHALITPVGITIERAGQLIKGGYSYRVKTDLKRNYEIWERGFTDHRLRVGEFHRFRRYIDENPVKAGLAKAPEDYPYGSASVKYDLDPPPARLLTAVAKAGGL